MHNRFDQFGKQMVSRLLEQRGAVDTDSEVSVDARHIDLFFMPDPIRSGDTGGLGLFGRMASGPCTFEFFHDTPSGEGLADCLIKHGNFRHFIALRKRTQQVPAQWVISSGRPNSGIDGLRFHPDIEWPSGFYDGPPLLHTWLVVVNELPVSRDTLLLRLLGAGRVLREAIAELKALGADEPERVIALPILLRLRIEVPTDPAEQASYEEFMMDTQDIVDAWRQEAVQEGVEQGLEQGVKVGVERGCAFSLIDLYEARFGAMPGELRGAIEATHDETMLRSWIKLAGTRSADELAAAIRATRAS